MGDVEEILVLFLKLTRMARALSESLVNYNCNINGLLFLACNICHSAVTEQRERFEAPWLPMVGRYM
jgi:hypothetical protein